MENTGEVIRCRCILCPNGCMLEIRRLPDGAVEVRGGRCSRGAKYGEVVASGGGQVLATTIALTEPVGDVRVVPVKSDRFIPVSDMKRVMAHLSRVKVSPPICMGDVLVHSPGGVNVNVIATRSVPSPLDNKRQD